VNEYVPGDDERRPPSIFNSVKGGESVREIRGGVLDGKFANPPSRYWGAKSG
jgi:hypothetical protein